MTAAVSPFGIVWRSSSRASCSFSRVSALAVKVIWYRSGASGVTTGRCRDGGGGIGAKRSGGGAGHGLDLLSKRPDGSERGIEVKGRAGVGDIELTENEWAKACNLRERYWLYVAYDCASPNPRLFRVRDPFGRLMASPKDGVRIDERVILQSAEGG